MVRKSHPYFPYKNSLSIFQEQFSGYMMVVDILVCFSLVKVNLGYHKPK